MSDNPTYEEVLSQFPDGFKEEFEDFIDNYGTYDGTFQYMKGWCMIQKRMVLSWQLLDDFCNATYGMPYKETFLHIHGYSDGCLRKAITNLAKDGNSKALDIASEYFMKLGQDQAKANAKITINAVIPLDNKEENDNAK